MTAFIGPVKVQNYRDSVVLEVVERGHGWGSHDRYVRAPLTSRETAELTMHLFAAVFSKELIDGLESKGLQEAYNALCRAADKIKAATK